MQALARQGLTDEQVRTLLHADALLVAPGMELLAADLTVIGDLSGDLLDGTVEHNLLAPIHRTCNLTLSRDLAWGVDLVRPYTVLTDTVSKVSARFDLGVFTLTTPADALGETVPAYSVQGYDRLYLLDRPVGDSYTTGTNVLTAVKQAVTDAGLSGVLLDGTASAATLPVGLSFPLVTEQRGADGRTDRSGVTTWLNVVNDLLATVGYRSLWADERGVFRSGPYVEPTARPSEFTFDADERATLVGQDRTRVQDKWRAVNRWVFVRRNLGGDPPPAPTEGAGIYVVPNGTGLLTRAKIVPDVDVVDQAALVAYGDRVVADDRRGVAPKLTITTGPLPVAGHADVVTYRDRALGQPVKCQAVRWQQPILGGDCTWDLEVIA